MRRSLILHPLALTALVVLVVNDHVLKARYPGWVTGKLSDFAGLILLPILIVATVELATRKPLSRSALWAVSLVVALGFVAIETTDLGAQVYEHGMGLMQLPFRYLISGADVAAPVRHVADLADLIALPATYVVCLIGRSLSEPKSGEVRTSPWPPSADLTVSRSPRSAGGHNPQPHSSSV